MNNPRRCWELSTQHDKPMTRSIRDYWFDCALARAKRDPDHYLLISQGIGRRDALIEITWVGKRGAIYGRRLYRHGDKGAERQWGHRR